MVTFVVEKYWISELAGMKAPVRLYMSDSDGQYRGYISFREEYTGAQDFVVHPNGIINAYMPLSKLHPTLDILRYEKPVYFSVNEKYNWAGLSTGAEPTGEEEGGGA